MVRRVTQGYGDGRFQFWLDWVDGELVFEAVRAGTDHLLEPSAAVLDFLSRIKMHDYVTLGVLEPVIRVTPGDPGSAVLRATERGRRPFETVLRPAGSRLECTGTSYS